MLTVIDCVVAPFDHRKDDPDDAVRVTLPPLQNVVAPLAAIVGVACDETLVVAEPALVQAAFETVTER